jgi:hypothetical protein
MVDIPNQIQQTYPEYDKGNHTRIRMYKGTRTFRQGYE